MINSEREETRRYPVWQLTDGTIVIQTEPGADLSDDDIRSIHAAGYYEKGFFVGLKHQIYKLLELI